MIKKYDQDKQISKAMPVMDQEALDLAEALIEKYLRANKSTHYGLIAPGVSYITIFICEFPKTSSHFAREILKFATTDPGLIESYGEIKYVDTSRDETYVEIWLGEEHFALMPVDSLFVEL